MRSQAELPKKLSILRELLNHGADVAPLQLSIETDIGGASPELMKLLRESRRAVIAPAGAGWAHRKPPMPSRTLVRVLPRPRTSPAFALGRP